MFGFHHVDRHGKTMSYVEDGNSVTLCALLSRNRWKKSLFFLVHVVQQVFRERMKGIFHFKHLWMRCTITSANFFRQGPDHPEVFEIGKVFAVTSSKLAHHFGCEESTLFPYIARLGTDQQPELPAMANGGVGHPITRMMADHDQAGDELRTLRVLTNNYTPPPAACPTWRALYRALEDLEQDLHQHIHLENNILFPRALAQSTKVA